MNINKFFAIVCSMISMRFFMRTIIVIFLLLINNSSFTMIIKDKSEENFAAQERKKIKKLEKQGWDNLKQIYENADNPEFVKKSLLNEENDVPIIFINQSPIITKEHIKGMIINPYKLLTSEDFFLCKEKHERSYASGYNNFIEKIKQKKFELLGSDAQKTPINSWAMTSYDNNWLIMKAVLFGTKDDVIHVLDNYIKDNVTRKVIKHELKAAITAVIDCSHVKKDILELLLWEKKKFHIYDRYTSHPGIKALNLLAIAAKNKKAFSLVMTIDSYRQHNKASFFDGSNGEWATLLDGMYEDDNFDEEHIKIMRDDGARRKIELGQGCLKFTEYELGLDNLKTVYQNQTPRFVRKFLSDEKNYISIYLIRSTDEIANKIFFGSLLNPYETSFYTNAEDQHFTDTIIKIGKKRLDKYLEGEKLSYKDLVAIESLDINNPLIKTIILGNQQDIETELIKIKNKEKNKKSVYDTLNKAIGAAIIFHKMEALKFLLYEQKIFIRNCFSFDDTFRGKNSFLLIRISLRDVTVLELVSMIDPYSANKLPWKDDNEQEYKTNLDRLLLLNLNSDFYNFLILKCGWLTAEQVCTYNEQFIDDIIKKLLSRNYVETLECNRIIENSSWSWVQKQRASDMSSVD